MMKYQMVFAGYKLASINFQEYKLAGKRYISMCVHDLHTNIR